MKRRLQRFLVIGLVVLAFPALVYAVQTNVTVRVKAHDAKFIGTAVGGLQVVVTDTASGKILSSGILEGGTGNTKTIMKEPVARGQRLSDKATAQYVAKLDIDHPTKIKISVRGPLAAGNNIQTASRTLWVLPGHHITGDGIVFEMYGFIVYPTSPGPHHFFKYGETIPITARIDMMCGCPIKPNGIWDANKYKVTAYIEKSGKTIAALPMKFSGKTSIFSTSYTPEKSGGYKIVITASDDATANYGVGITSFVVKKKKAAK